MTTHKPAILAQFDFRVRDCCTPGPTVGASAAGDYFIACRIATGVAPTGSSLLCRAEAVFTTIMIDTPTDPVCNHDNAVVSIPAGSEFEILPDAGQLVIAGPYASDIKRTSAALEPLELRPHSRCDPAPAGQGLTPPKAPLPNAEVGHQHGQSQQQAVPRPAACRALFSQDPRPLLSEAPVRNTLWIQAPPCA